jgi:predicted ATPase
MRIFVNSQHKSIPSGISFELPNFCILTGKNGSGKSHLLEAIADPNKSRTVINGTEIRNIQYVSFNGLNPQVDDQCDSSQVIANSRKWWDSINGIIQNYKQSINNGEVFQDLVTQFFPRFGNNPHLFSIIQNVLKLSGKDLSELTEDDVLNNISFVDITENALFFSKCAMIFKAYHSRQIKNEFAEFRATKHGVSGIHFLSRSDFLRKYGPPPWELINDILKRANLPYKVTSPDIGDFDLPYRLRLVGTQKELEISVNDLSSGEKVLMSLALAIYNTQEGGSKPELLLLDEPDAPLHPQFSKLLVETLIETIVNKSGVNVIITTHSPSTVAMAPDNCIFEIDQSNKIPFMVSNIHAVETLTEGINYLRVSFEKRRQVFVESKYDVQYFQRLHALLARKHNFTYSPIFLEPHSGSSNCSDVLGIVQKLRDSGNDLVRGIIDWDTHNKTTEAIVVLGEDSRYAIENYLLDPLYVSLALIRYAKNSFADFGIQRHSVYTDAINLTAKECQTIVDFLFTKIGLSLDEKSPSQLENGFLINYPKSFLHHHGHKYEVKVQETFPELIALSRGQGDSALKLAMMQVIEEFPQFLCADVANTFKLVLGYNT